MPSVPMLMYHKVAELDPASRHPQLCVGPEAFARQLALLRAMGRTPITLARYVAHRRGAGALPALPVVITFDDGYRSNLEVALPILERHGCPATIFIVSRLLGGTNVWDPDEPQEPLLDLRDVREMQRAGIDFQSHTATHARLTAIPPDAALGELRESREALEQALGAPVEAIAYPWGAHDATVERLAAEAGYVAGVVVRRRTNHDRTPALALRRIPVWRSTPLAQLAWDLVRLPFRGD